MRTKNWNGQAKKSVKQKKIIQKDNRTNVTATIFVWEQLKTISMVNQENLSIATQNIERLLKVSETTTSLSRWLVAAFEFQQRISP